PRYPLASSYNSCAERLSLPSGLTAGARPCANVEIAASSKKAIEKTLEVIFARRRLLWKSVHQLKEPVGFRFGNARLHKIARQFHHKDPVQANRQRHAAAVPPRYRPQANPKLRARSRVHFAGSC